jgi:hypothetical protein
MQFDLSHIIEGAFLFGLVLFFIYRRFRRLFGRQKLNRGYMIFRVVLLCIVGALLLIPTIFSKELALVTLVGVAIGIGLAIWAAKHTRFERQDGELYYIPHTYAGMVVSALFLGRIVYKIVAVSKSKLGVATMDATPSMSDFGGFSGLYHNPITRLVFFILIGYYVYYYLYVLRESKHLKPEDWEKPASPPATGGNV